MSNDDKNFNEEDFKDFEDVSDNIELDSDISAMDDEAFERAFKNIAKHLPNEAQTPFTSGDNTGFDSENSIFSNQENEIDHEIPEQSEEVVETQDTSSQIEKTQIETSNENEITHINNETQNIHLNTEDELSQWEELNNKNNVVKKYIVYISKDFVPYIDNMTADERSAYINDAIQQKIDQQNLKKQKILKRNAIIHFVLAIITILALTPIGLFLANRAIIATFNNYKYSQENFEKLYKHRFEHDKAYIRSLEYNKEQEKKLKNKTN